jgi:protein ImuB
VGDERGYIKEIINKFRASGYDARAAIADTVGAAWAVARFAKKNPIVENGMQVQALMDLPPAALRLEPVIADKLKKLGFYQLKKLIEMPRMVLTLLAGTLGKTSCFADRNSGDFLADVKTYFY